MIDHSPAPGHSRLRRAFVALVLAGLLLPSAPLQVTAQQATATATAESGSSSEVAPELPPADLPTLNPQGYTFQFKATLRTDLDGVPREAPVYALARVYPSYESADILRARLGITGQLVEQGSGVWLANGGGSLYVSPDFIQYTSVNVARPGSLPDDDTAIAAAEEWLRAKELAPSDLGAGRVVERLPDVGRVIVQFGPSEPVNVLAAIPGITVSIGVDGAVLEVSSRWMTVGRGDVYQLRTAEDAWQQVLTGQAFIEADIAEVGIPAGSIIEGNASYNNVMIAYTTAGPPGGDQYLVPVFIFRGRVRLEGGEKTYAIRGYVPALANSGQPVG